MLLLVVIQKDHWFDVSVGPGTFCILISNARMVCFEMDCCISASQNVSFFSFTGTNTLVLEMVYSALDLSWWRRIALIFSIAD